MIKKVLSTFLFFFGTLSWVSGNARLVFTNEASQWDGSEFIIDINNDTAGSVVDLKFGQDVDARIQFDRISDSFLVNRNFNFEDHQLLSARFENLAAAPTCDTSVTGKVYFDTSDSQTYICDGVDWKILSEDFTEEIIATAQAYSNNLEARLIATGGVEGGNLGKVPLFVLNTTDGKAQITSLEDGNECVAYLTGNDFSTGNAQERVFLKKGEIYIFESLQGGSVINCLEGAYGFSGQVNGNNESPMPLGSLGLSFTDTFFFAFRNSTNATSDIGLIYVSNGPVESTVALRTGAGAVVDGQADVVLEPYGFHVFHTAGNVEYRLTSDNPIVAGINARMSNYTGNGSFYDSRLIMPLTNDAITWPRSGQMSALYDNTQVDFWVRDGVEGQMNSTAGTGISPGSPIDMDAAIGVGTGANDADYEPNGATRFKANGFISGFSGADSSGLEATPLWPVNAFVQRAALPLAIENSGDGGNNGVAVTSIYEGTAKVYEWDPVLEEVVLAYTLPLTRNIGGTTTRDDQNHPAAALLSPNAAESTVQMTADFYGGYVEADVPIHVVFNSEQNEDQATTVTRKGTSGASVIAINSDDDEQATSGITPQTIRNETREDANGVLRKRVIDGVGTDTWVVE